MPTERKYREDIVRYGRTLHQKGYVAAMDGNLSVRLKGDRVLVTPTCVSKGGMRATDMVVVDLEGTKIAGRRNVTSEIGMHLLIYRTRPDVQAIVHAHPPYATAYAVAGMALDQPILSEAILTLGRVPVASYAMPTAEELARSVEPLVEHHDAVLLRFHGAICFARDIEQAGYLMETLEHVARIDFIRRSLGSNELIPAHEVQRLEELRASMRAR